MDWNYLEVLHVLAVKADITRLLAHLVAPYDDFELSADFAAGVVHTLAYAATPETLAALAAALAVDARQPTASRVAASPKLALRCHLLVWRAVRLQCKLMNKSWMERGV